MSALSTVLEIEKYQNCPLPEDYEITELLNDIIMVSYADTASDGKSLVRKGIILPDSVNTGNAWRVGLVELVGPDVKRLKKKDYIIFPGDKGMPAVSRDGKLVVFLNEDRIFGICKVKAEVKAEVKKKK